MREITYDEEEQTTTIFNAEIFGVLIIDKFKPWLQWKAHIQPMIQQLCSNSCTHEPKTIRQISQGKFF